jgi:hypothetical protein
MKVLIHAAYGAGFSTCEQGAARLALATDPALVAIVEAPNQSQDAFEARCRNLVDIHEGPGVSAGAWVPSVDDMRVVEVPTGVRWRIVQYDGLESVETEADMAWWGVAQ